MVILLDIGILISQVDGRRDVCCEHFPSVFEFLGTSFVMLTNFPTKSLCHWSGRWLDGGVWGLQW